MSDADNQGFRYAFYSAINAYKNGCIPIGCAILDVDGKLISRGENCQYASKTSEAISGHPLAHAEINAILKTSSYEHPRIKDYVLYTTMESCPLCFGAIVMGNIRNVRFAALDKDNDFTRLNTSVDFISRQNISIEGQFEKFQIIQIALIACRRLEEELEDNWKFLDMYNSYCPEGVQLGSRLYNDVHFHQLMTEKDNEEPILNYVSSCI